jgi:hypothetical protein
MLRSLHHGFPSLLALAIENRDQNSFGDPNLESEDAKINEY